MFRKAAILLALAVPLVAASCDEKLQSVAVKTCNALDVIYDHYDSLAASGAIPASYMNRVELARKQTDKGCANPSTLTTVQLTRIAGEAYLALRAALKAGSGEGAEDYDAVKGLEKLETLRSTLQKL